MTLFGKQERRQHMKLNKLKIKISIYSIPGFFPCFSAHSKIAERRVRHGTSCGLGGIVSPFIGEVLWFVNHAVMAERSYRNPSGARTGSAIRQQVIGHRYSFGGGASPSIGVAGDVESEIGGGEFGCAGVGGTVTIGVFRFEVASD